MTHNQSNNPPVLSTQSPEDYAKDPAEPFSEETLQALIELGAVLQGIHDRMIAEGYPTKDGKLIKPKEYDKPNH